MAVVPVFFLAVCVPVRPQQQQLLYFFSLSFHFHLCLPTTIILITRSLSLLFTIFFLSFFDFLFGGFRSLLCDIIYSERQLCPRSSKHFHADFSITLVFCLLTHVLDWIGLVKVPSHSSANQFCPARVKFMMTFDPRKKL